MNTTANRAPASATGKIVVLSIFGVALLAASFALYWNMSRSRRALAFWGAEDVRRIQKSDRVEILILEAADDSQPEAESFQIGGQRLSPARTIDVTQARGLIHARHALTTDASFEPGEPAELQAGDWSHAIRFTDGQGTTVLLFNGQRVGHYQTQQELKLIPKVADGWRRFVERETKK